MKKIDEVPLSIRPNPTPTSVFSQFGVFIVNPLSYLEFNYLVQHAKVVITDSGGITEETTFMGIPCMTLRDNTERPETVEIGTNILVGNNIDKLKIALLDLFNNKWKKGKIPPNLGWEIFNPKPWGRKRGPPRCSRLRTARSSR